MIQGKVHIHLFETAVLFLKFLHTTQLLTFHPEILLLPIKYCGLGAPQLPADIRSRFTLFILIDSRNNLTFNDSCLFHCTVVSYEFTQFKKSFSRKGIHIASTPDTQVSLNVNEVNNTLLIYPNAIQLW